MLDFIYALLDRIGYTHPVRPALTHLPVGLVMGAFLFALGALALKRAAWGQTARHCTVLALLALPPTIVFGVVDWQHHYAGAWLFPIIMKLLLAGLLLVLLTAAIVLGLKELYGRQTLTGSGWPVDDAHVRRQLVAPFKEMPPFTQLPPEQLDALVAYLQAL